MDGSKILSSTIDVRNTFVEVRIMKGKVRLGLGTKRKT